MASSSGIEDVLDDDTGEIPHYILARYGVSRLLNNRTDEAENLFKAYPESLDMNAGYAYAVFSDAVMTFEEDKIQKALRFLKHLEKKCIANTQSAGWFKSVQKKIWGNEPNSEMQVANQIVLADCYVLVAALTFLQQDISGFIKASWLLRKAYKNYQNAYSVVQGLLPDDVVISSTKENKAEHKHKILDVFKEHNLGNESREQSQTLIRPKSEEDVLQSPDMHVQLVDVDEAQSVASHQSIKQEVASLVGNLVPTDDVLFGLIDPKTASKHNHHHHHHQQIDNSDPHDPQKPLTIHDHAHHHQHHHHTYHPQGIKTKDLPCDDITASKFPRRTPSGVLKNGFMVIPSFSSSLGSDEVKENVEKKAEEGYVRQQFISSTQNQSKMRKSRSEHDDVKATRQPTTLTTSLSFLTTPLNLFTFKKTRKPDIDPDLLERLHCQVSFGFGLLQLGISLLPPSILKLINFFGFGGNRKTGLEYLMMARKGDDLRAPFATLALLWYHTIIRPFFALDGNNVQAGVGIAAQLIRETRHEFSESAIFLFFMGRVERLEPDIEAAIDAFDQAISNSTQREVKVMAMHEVGWCYLILLDYNNAENTFLCLKQASRWSRPFYSYIAMICAGAHNQFRERDQPMDVRNYFPPVTKGTQLDEFLNRRYKICPTNDIVLRDMNVLFWKLLTYEMLYLWNTLPSCSFRIVDRISKDCVEAHKQEVEPFVGLGKLIEGSCQCILGRISIGIVCFRECDNMRKLLPVNAADAHVSAFANYELGLLLLKDKETAAEGREILEHTIRTYKGYDFEQRLTVRVHAILKNLS